MKRSIFTAGALALAAIITSPVNGGVDGGFDGGFDGGTIGGSLWGIAQGSAFAVAVGPGGQVGVSEDGGAWRNRKIKDGGLLLAVDVAGHTTVFAVGGQGGFADGRAVVLRSRDRGQTFTRLTGVPGRTLYEIKFIAPDVGYAAGVGGTLLRTTDRGRTWSALRTGTKANLWAIQFDDAGNGLVGGGDTPWQNDGRSSGVILRTADGGETWTTVHQGTKRISDFSFVDANLGYAGLVGGGLLRTMDGGRTWVAAGKTPLSAIVNAVAFFSARCGVVVGSGGTAYVTTDGAASWSRKIIVTKGSFLEDLEPAVGGGYWVAGGDGSVGVIRLPDGC